MVGRSPAVGRARLPSKAPFIAVIVIFLLSALPSSSWAEEGQATWYGEPFHGRTMANGQVYNMHDPTTTASNQYPFGTWLKVTNAANGRSVVVQVRDRGGFSHALDLSYAAFAALDEPKLMWLRVKYEVVAGPDGAPLNVAPAPTPTPTATPTPAPTPKPAPKSPPTEYVVALGDTLFAVARRFGLELDVLARWNDLVDPDRLVAGQRLVLRAPSVTQSAAPSTRGQAPVVQQLPLAGTYVVVEGDTLWGIAIEHGTTPERLAGLNELSGELIVVGQSLRLPSSSASPAAGSAARASGRHTVEEGDTLLGLAFDYGTTVVNLMQINGLTDADFLQIGQVLLLP